MNDKDRGLFVAFFLEAALQEAQKTLLCAATPADRATADTTRQRLRAQLMQLRQGEVLL